jgi:cytochrome c peroxidase
MAIPETNPLTPEKIALGRRLFFDTSLSVDRTMSCATCHDPERGYTDGRAVAKGVHDAAGARNTPTILNAGFGRSFFWDGRAATLEEQVLGPIVNPKELGLTERDLTQRTGLEPKDVAAALASYVRTIRSGESRYDWFLAGQSEMLTSEERLGLEIFRGRAGCTTCHGGPNLTDDRFHNTGVGWGSNGPSDDGRFAVTGAEADRGAFKTPTLRDIARTAPYMHDGSQPTLESVVEFYARGGNRNPNLDPRMRPEQFRPDEKQALVAFLKTLNGRATEGLPER